MNKNKTETRPCPKCHDQKAKIEIREIHSPSEGTTETWVHVGPGCKKVYRTS